MARSATIWLLVVFALACADTPPPAPAPPPLTSEFSGTQAFAHLSALVAIGPRVPETDGAEQARAYLRGQLEALGLEVTSQTEDFLARDGERLGEVENLVAVIPGASTDLVVLAAPYDSQDLGDVRFVGANDGASGAALLLELARVLAADPLPYTTWLAFLGREAPHRADLDDGLGFIGSAMLVDQLREAERLADVRAMIYYNQVADRELHIRRDLRSHRRYREAFFDAARQLGYAEAFPGDEAFSSPNGGHLVFWGSGVRRALLITDDRFGGDETPGEWSHTEQDDLEHCSAESLEAVGRTSEAALRRITATLAKIDRFTRRPEPSEPMVDEPAEADETEGMDEASPEPGGAAPQEAAQGPDAQEASQAPAPPEEAPAPPGASPAVPIPENATTPEESGMRAP